MRILYVEDEKILAEAVTYLLKKQKIDVDWASDGEQGLDLALKNNYDVIVLDIMLPKLSGLDILKTVRDRGVQTPIIILSALNETEDKVRGLELGADDYLSKPFRTQELIARINALVRRPPFIEEKTMEYDDLVLNLTNRTLNEIPLTEKEAEIMKLLIKNAGNVVAKKQILTYVWGHDINTEENYVEVYMSYIRRKIKQAKSKVKINTVRNLGYKLSNV